MSKTLVIGAHGVVGSELVRLLSAEGKTVVGSTSRAASRPNEVHLNLVTGEGLVDAFNGIERAFLLSPAGHANQEAVLKPLIDQAGESGVRKIVLMTAMGANADEASPMRKAEQHLIKSGIAYNIIRPNWFMQNFNSFWIHGILTQGKILLPAGQAKGSFIDSRDISAVAAALLFRNDLDGKDFDLTGSVALDHDQVATILSKETGRSISYEDITPEAMRGGLLAAGLPADYVELLLMILSFFKAGYAERITDSVQMITGKAPRTFEQYAKDFRSAWLA